MLFMNLTGQMVEALSYQAVFVIMGFLHPAAFLFCRLMVSGTPAPAQDPAQQPVLAFAPRN
jgi:hypothetical protein